MFGSDCETIIVGNQSKFKLLFSLQLPQSLTKNHPNTHKSITESVTLSRSPGDSEGFAGLV